jgi:AraC family transcriptional regulator of adaptative response / DNA-3-methyladenine glycosylase II
MPAIESGFDERYRALASRDARFDGRFIAGVHSTGIYCRPSCPAVTPKPGNVRFYRTAAAAQDAGLRACKRCQPDAVPGIAGWDLRGETTTRAVRLIDAGVVDREGVTGLAAHLGYSPRQLSRLLVDELGAGPLALARARRAQTARALLLGTSLPVADVAFAAGFGSIRQCNDTLREVYAMSPTQLRGSRAVEHDRRSASSATTIAVRLRATPPFDGDGVVRYLADHAIGGLERVEHGVFERPIRLQHGAGTMRVWVDDADRTGVTAQLALDDLSDLEQAVAGVRTMFDLDADAPAIDAALVTDPRLTPLVAAFPGVRIPGSADPTETLIRTMVGQQVSIAGASTLLGRLVDSIGDGAFPTPAAIAERGRTALVGPTKRIDAIIGTASAIADGSLRLDAETPEELVARLVAMPGIGPWTAGYVAMRTMRAPDVLLSTDLVMLHAARALGIAQDARGLAAAGASWSPWRSYAGLRLWRSRA